MIKTEQLKKATQYFINIYKRKCDLVDRLLDFSDDPQDSLIDANQDKLMAFKLLMHAEIEYYIECVTRDVLNLCKKEWTSSYHLNPILLRLLTYHQTEYAGNPRDNNPKDRIANIINNALNQIGKNNGIKEKNQLKLMQQIGINIMGDHNTLSNDLDSYGAHRGEIAHNGISAISRQLTKPVEINKINQIIDSLYDLDIDAQKIKSYIIYPVTFSNLVGI